jgi:hypothetical protein
MILRNDRGVYYSLAFSSITSVDLSSADVEFTVPAQLYIGTAGDIKIDTPESTGVTLKNVPLGILPIIVTKVYKIGTVAQEIIALR